MLSGQFTNRKGGFHVQIHRDSLCCAGYLAFKDGDSVSAAAKNEIVRQIPYALDILAMRHPLLIGLVRNALNEHGEVDRFAESYVRASMDQAKTPNVIESYAVYYFDYFVMFDEDQVRIEIANSMEKKFGL